MRIGNVFIQLCLEDPLSGSKTIELRMYFPLDISDFGFSASARYRYSVPLSVILDTAGR
jgi:hypothetical protein